MAEASGKGSKADGTNRGAAAGRPDRTRRRGRNVLFVILAVVGALALVEGLVSMGLWVYDLAARAERPVAERLHTQYDETLGWVNVPGKAVEDLYGPGRSVHIDERGFRVCPGGEAAGDGVTRIVCTGDSFTFGYGVDDGDTWPAKLASRPGVACVNMGQGGYGLDQMYLWYRRDGAKLAPDVHLLAVIPQDFDRMRRRTFLGYGKPTLKLEGGVPVADNVPVPKRGFTWPWLTANRDLLTRLRVAELIARIAGGGQEDRPLDEPAMGVEKSFSLALHAMGTLHATAEARGELFAVVFLPTRYDYDQPVSDALRKALAQQLAAQQVRFIDLVPYFRGLTEDRAEAMFIRPGEIDFPDAAWHYTPAGNRWVAERIAEALRLP